MPKMGVDHRKRYNKLRRYKMTTATMVTGTLTTQTGVRPRRSLEELVDRLMATLTFRHEPATAAANSLEGAMPVSTSRSRTMLRR